MFKWIILFCVLGIVFSLMSGRGPVSLGPGVRAPEAPEQTTITNRTPFHHRGNELVPLAGYSIKAKVLSKKSYNRGMGSDICPLDLALGWGPMSDETILEGIEIRQSGRFYYWSTREYPIERSEIIESSANVHIIPATDAIESILKQIRSGQIVYLEGKLVEVRSPSGWNVTSSLTRNDAGAGACEVLFVEAAFRCDT